MKEKKEFLKDLFVYKQPEKKKEFILKNNNFDKTSPKSNKNSKKEGNSKSSANTTDSEDAKGSNAKVSKKIEENLEKIKKIYNVPKNADLMIREIELTFKDKGIDAFLVFIDGMVDRKVINDDILVPLMLLSNLDIKSNEVDVSSYIEKKLIAHNQLKSTEEFSEVIHEINFGGCALFVDGVNVAYAADVKGWAHRDISRPNTELVIRGPQEGFNEVLRANTALVRKILLDEDLIVESFEVGRRSKTPGSILYIKNIANDSLVEEVRKRVNNLDVDHVSDSGQLEQLIEDNSYLPLPQIVATERPDRVSEALVNGKVSVVLHGSPFALIMPATLQEFFETPEDTYLRFPYTNLMKLIRIIGVLLSLLFPAIYLAITNYHHEMIPTDLILAITTAREQVPFPTILELLIMEFAFELIREAGIRIPGPIGPTLGIIGGLILGQAAVAANIVSPILIIVVAVTGIGSFAAPEFSLGFAFRILRFGFLFLASLSGFLGITTGVFLLGIWLANTNSFGVPFLSPFSPRTTDGIYNQILKTPIWRQEKRSDYLSPKATKKQPKISRKWIR